MLDPVLLAEKLDCYRRSRKPELCINRKCPYNQNKPDALTFTDCRENLLSDAVEILNSLAPVRPVIGGLYGHMWECGACNAPVGIVGDDKRDLYCRLCGKKVLWDG